LGRRKRRRKFVRIYHACHLFAAALRGACHPHKSVPAMPKRKSGRGFLAAEMKEYDA
jgi:ribosomal protein L13E